MAYHPIATRMAQKKEKGGRDRESRDAEEVEPLPLPL